MKAWTKGDRVVQPNYGPGTLVEVNEHHTVIDFDEHGRSVCDASGRPASHQRARAGREAGAEARGEKESELGRTHRSAVTPAVFPASTAASGRTPTSRRSTPTGRLSRRSRAASAAPLPIRAPARAAGVRT